jgi:hypothetical protein
VPACPSEEGMLVGKKAKGEIPFFFLILQRREEAESNCNVVWINFHINMGG